MSADQTDLVVAIVSWNVRELLDQCLGALWPALENAAITSEVWVVDNASTDGSVTWVRDRHPWVRVVASPENLGFVRANNILLDRYQDSARYIWLLNPDTVVHPAAVGHLLEFLDRHPQAGLIGPKLLNTDGTLQESAFGFPGLLQALFALGLMPARLYHTRLNGRYTPQLYAQPAPFPVDHPLGAAMMVRGEAVRDVGLLDERYFMYCEEIDWAWRMQRAGWERWLIPAAEVVHVGGASTRQAKPETTGHLWVSRARLYRTHRPRLEAAVTGLAVRAVFRHHLVRADSDAWRLAYSRISEAWR